MEKKYPSGPSEFFDYDAYGRLEFHTSRRSIVTTVSYNYDGQPNGIYHDGPGSLYQNLSVTFDPCRRPETRTITGQQGTSIR
jgi:hypothetical protein